MKIVDCTIRDGGHLNKWDFSIECVASSYKAASLAKIDYFEIGYRYPCSKKNLGAFAYCKESFLQYFITSANITKLTIMINASDLKLMDLPIPATESLIKAIRIAAYPYEIKTALEYAEKFYDLGYEVFLNLMVFAEYTQEHLSILEQWNGKNKIVALYYADSFGAFLPTNVVTYYFRLRDIGYKNIGFHAHNNLQLAFANTIAAMETGVSYVDATIYGMGRGSGNLPIELLLAYAQKHKILDKSPIPYFDPIQKYYAVLREQLKWGYNLKSLSGGAREIHPYYVDALYDKGYTMENIWELLEIVKKGCPISFSIESLNNVLKSVPLC